MLASNDLEMRGLGRLALYKHLRMMSISGDYKGAVQQAARLLASDEEAMGPQDPYTATSVNDLAELFMKQGALVHPAAAAWP